MGQRSIQRATGWCGNASSERTRINHDCLTRGANPFTRRVTPRRALTATRLVRYLQIAKTLGVWCLGMLRSARRES